MSRFFLIRCFGRTQIIQSDLLFNILKIRKSAGQTGNMNQGLD